MEYSEIQNLKLYQHLLLVLVYFFFIHKLTSHCLKAVVSVNYWFCLTLDICEN